MFAFAIGARARRDGRSRACPSGSSRRAADRRPPSSGSRAGPDSAKEIALVATLAGAAAAGRVLFAAVPGVQPVTVMTIVAGAALGLRAGVAVGMLAAFVSNFFLAQGPWTPYQMLAWGACGALGALLAPLLRRRIALAVVAFVLGFAFSTFMDVWEWFAFWPHDCALARARPRPRLPVQPRARDRQLRARAGRRAGAAPPARTLRPPHARGGRVGLKLLASLAAAAFCARDARRRTCSSQQQPDGGWGSPQMTAWSALGLRAAGADTGGALDYLVAHEAELSKPTEIALVASAEAALGHDPSTLLARLPAKPHGGERRGLGDLRAASERPARAARRSSRTCRARRRETAASRG